MIIDTTTVTLIISLSIFTVLVTVIAIEIEYRVSSFFTKRKIKDDPVVYDRLTRKLDL